MCFLVLEPCQVVFFLWERVSIMVTPQVVGQYVEGVDRETIIDSFLSKEHKDFAGEVLDRLSSKREEVLKLLKEDGGWVLIDTLSGGSYVLTTAALNLLLKEGAVERSPSVSVGFPKDVWNIVQFAWKLGG